MAYELRDNSGTLFKNTRKELDKHPDYQGDCMINGKKLRISAWIKQGQKGKFMSLAFSEPRPPRAQSAPATSAPDEPGF